MTKTLGLAIVASPRASVTVVAVVTGLVVGSFLNVVIYRVPRGLSVVQPRSFCPACGMSIRASDNVPVMSWLVLGGRCRGCREPISARYPAVELGTGAVFGGTAWALGAHWGVPGMCTLGATMLALAVIELDGLPPSAAVSLIGTGLGVLLLSAAALADRRWWHLGGMLIGVGAASCAVVASWAARRGRQGSGLPWALIPAGAVMGWVGPLGALVGVVTSAVVLAGLLGLSRVRARHHGSPAAIGTAVAAAAGSIAAVIGALVGGNSIGL